MYKKGNLKSAFDFYHQALEVDENNLDALVARGAWLVQFYLKKNIFGELFFRFANDRQFEKAIFDLEKAVSLDPCHKNASIYLATTYAARAHLFETQKKFKEAYDDLKFVFKIFKKTFFYYFLIRRSLELQPRHEGLRIRLEALQEKIFAAVFFLLLKKIVFF